MTVSQIAVKEEKEDANNELWLQAINLKSNVWQSVKEHNDLRTQ